MVQRGRKCVFGAKEIILRPAAAYLSDRPLVCEQLNASYLEDSLMIDWREMAYVQVIDLCPTIAEETDLRRLHTLIDELRILLRSEMAELRIESSMQAHAHCQRA